MNELDSTCGISDEELTERFKAAYLEYPDGRRKYTTKDEKTNSE